MGKLTKLQRYAGWAVFAIAAIVYIISAERTGSLWDCGEFILGAYKLQVVHPPGAPLFILIGRMFAGVGQIFSDDPATIAFFVNLMSGLFTALGCAFVAWVAIRLGKLALVGRAADAEMTKDEDVALSLGGLAAGLTTAFCTSVWFSAVEGEVYALSFFFTCMTFWAGIRYYTTPQTENNTAYRFLIFSILSIGLSIGVHLLSLLVLPAIGILVYLRERDQPFLSTLGMGAGILMAIGLLISGGSIGAKIGGAVVAAGGGLALSSIKRPPLWLGCGLAALGGAAMIIFIQNAVIVGIPTIWQGFEIPMVNNGLPVHSGIIPTLAIYVGLIYLAFRYAARKNNQGIQLLGMAAAVSVIAYSIIGVVVIRAGAQPPVNMNNPDNVTSLLPYLNREQYGERSLLRGPHFEAQYRRTESAGERWGLINDDGSPRYEVVSEKIEPVYEDRDMMLFPRMSDNTQGRPRLYKRWMGMTEEEANQPLRKVPGLADNVGFMIRYQMGWMYWRYFMWNFSGRQNGQQGFYAWDESRGNWISGIGFLDSARLGDQSNLPEEFRNDPARNTYFLLPFLFGLLGLFWHAKKDMEGFYPLLALFLMTGLGIILYTNQPPNEPRERDYVLVGSFMAYAIWIGLAIPALYSWGKSQLSPQLTSYAAGGLVLVAPLLMLTQNFNDHDRSEHAGARDYAHNFLESVDENAIIFTYGDNDTYPLWYAQEVENIRTDVRVVNLSLIAVDWYINLLRRKVNDSPAIAMGLPPAKIRANLRNAIPRFNDRIRSLPQDQPYPACNTDRPTPLSNFMQQVTADRPLGTAGGGQIPTYYESCNVFIDVDPNRARTGEAGLIPPGDTNFVRRIPIDIPGRSVSDRLFKDELAILDIINSNLYDRPIYWAVTCQSEKMMGLDNFLELEGLALRLTATRCRGDQQNYGVIGKGCVDTDKNLDLVQNVWKWGNFDEVDTHVNDSYNPAVQSMQLVIRRTAGDLMNSGRVEDGLSMLDQYFQAFPNKNFPFFYQTLFMLTPYWDAGQFERARPVMVQLAENTADRLDFYDSLDPNIVRSSYGQDYARAGRIVEDLVNAARRSGDEALQAEIERILTAHLYIVDQQQQLPG
ncbi:MAG: DUF2723 domain-containing protein [Bacteroidota bacterium]